MRRIAALFLALCMTLTLISCGKKDEAIEALSPGGTGQDADEVTRGEWLSMLADAFGLDGYEDDTPYYADVPKGSGLFPAVQSAHEWGILSALAGERLEPDKAVSRGEVAETAAYAVGFEEIESQTATDFASENGIISKTVSLTEPATRAECETAIDAALLLYLQAPIETVEYQLSGELLDLRAIPSSDVTIKENSIDISDKYLDLGNGVPEIHVGGEVFAPVGGDVLILPPTKEYPFGAARKVVGTFVSAGTIGYSTERPNFDEIYSDLSVHTTVPVDLSQIIWADGVSVTPAQAVNPLAFGGMGYRAELLSTTGKAPKVTRLDTYDHTIQEIYDFTFTSGDFTKTSTSGQAGILGSGEGAKTFNESNYVYDKTPSIEDFGGSTNAWTEKLKTENKFSGGYRITGNLAINEITVTVDVEYHEQPKFLEFLGWKGIPESASCQITSDIVSTLTFEGNLDERVKVGSIPCPIGTFGLGVMVDLYLYADASGTLRVQTVLGSTAKAEWQLLVDTKHAEQAQLNVSTAAAMTVNFGMGVSATVSTFDIEFMDLSVNAGGKLTSDAFVSGRCNVEPLGETTRQTYTESMNLSSELYVPISNIVFNFGKDCFEPIFDGISKTWDITTAERGARKHPVFNQAWEFWRAVVTLDRDGNVIDSEITTAGAATQEYDAERVFAELQNGDFSYFAGTYAVYEGYGSDGQPYSADGIYVDETMFPNITLNPDGSLAGTYYNLLGYGELVNGSYRGTPPIYVVKANQYYYNTEYFMCRVVEEEDPESPAAGGYYETYCIYPAGTYELFDQNWESMGMCDRDVITYTVTNGYSPEIVYIRTN